MVDEIYHDGYAAKRMEIGAVIAAAPAENVRRETPGCRAMRSSCLAAAQGATAVGGATGSSKAHTASRRIETCGAEVQKGNAPEERKLQRLFRNAEACRMIKRCNDFGAGGVSVAVGELADGLEHRSRPLCRRNMKALTARSWPSANRQERMAVVVEPEDVASFHRACTCGESRGDR